MTARFYNARQTERLIEAYGSPLSGDEVGRRVRAHRPELPCFLYLPNRLEDAGLALYRGAQLIFPLYYGNSTEALGWWHRHLDEQLLDKGWRFGSSGSREDIVVIVDSRGILRVDVPE